MAQVKLRHLLAQPLVGALALDFNLLEPQFIASQRLAQRTQQLGDGLLALVEISLRRRLDLAEFGLGQRRKLFVVLLQGLSREFGERPHHLLALLMGPKPQFVGSALELLEFGGRDGACRLGRRGSCHRLLKLGGQLDHRRLGVGQSGFRRAGLRLQGTMAHKVPDQSQPETY